MTTRSEADILDLCERFESCTLPASSWRHHDHLVVALAYVRRHGAREALVRMRSGIQRYNASLGKAPELYHESVTRAWVAIAACHAAVHPRDAAIERDVDEFLAACGGQDFLLRFYAKSTLASSEARFGWVPPDLEPIPGMNEIAGSH